MRSGTLDKQKTNPVDRTWLDDFGLIKTDVELRLLSKSWNNETWQIFLQETVDRPAPEEEVQFTEYLDRLGEETETPWEVGSTLPEFVEAKISAALKSLEKINRKVIYGRFWLKCSYRHLAETLGIAVSTAFSKQEVSLAQIRAQLENDPNIISYLIEGSQKFNSHEKSRDQQIIEVYKADRRGSYMK
jgi:DNA-directed RNA polymerase specialized sigma24 family protein